MCLVIISGALANKPFNGGNAWSRLSWIVGFRRLGFEVHFVEQLPARGVHATSTRQSETYFRSVMAQFGLTPHATLLAGNDVLCGPSLADLVPRAKASALLFNLSGHLTQPDLLAAAPCKVYYDDDPGFTQFWHASGSGGARLEGHDFYFTIGENIGLRRSSRREEARTETGNLSEPPHVGCSEEGCVIPTGGIPWRPTRPPVVPHVRPMCALRGIDRFTTRASWRGRMSCSGPGKDYSGLR
jgi:hypothetical protein